jgi:hypothetical protein
MMALLRSLIISRFWLWILGTIEHMKRIPAILLAGMIGVAIEVALGVVSVVAVLAGGIGPCGLTGDAPGLVRMIHQPGFWLARFLVKDSSPAYLPSAMLITTVFLSMAAFIVLKFRGERNELRSPDAAPEQRDGK